MPIDEDKKTLSRIGAIKQGLKNTLISDKNDQKKDFEADFYRDVDKNRNKNCCSLPIVIFLLSIIFVGILAGLYYFSKYSKQSISQIALHHNLERQDMSQSFIRDTESLASEETVILRYSDVEIGQYLGIADSDFPLKNARLQITESGIIIAGKANLGIIPLPVKAVIRPKISDNKLIFVMDEIATGSISMPKFIKDDLNNYLDIQMRSRSLSDPNIEIIRAATLQDYLEIEVHKK